MLEPTFIAVTNMAEPPSTWRNGQVKRPLLKNYNGLEPKTDYVGIALGRNLERVQSMCSGYETFYSGPTSAPAAKVKRDMVYY